MRIISRYVLREHLGPLLFAMSALTSLLLLNYIAKELPHLVGKGLPWDVVAEFILLSLPFTIAMTLPMAVLVATLHAFSRLAADSEITAFKASGLALPRIMRPVVAWGLILSLIMVWFNDQVMPAANYRLSTLQNDIARKKPTFALRPQVINEVSPRRLFLRAGHLEGGSSEMKDVTIFDFSDQNRRRTVRADSGHVQLSPDGRDLVLTLRHGEMTEVNQQEPSRLQRVFFTTNFIRVRGIGNELERNSSGGEKSDRERTICELNAQLRQAVHQRDSVFDAIKRLDSAVAKTVVPHGMTKGSGTAYCKLVKWMQPVIALAAEPPQAKPQVAVPQAAVPQQAPPAAQGVRDTARKALIAPSAGVLTPNPDDLQTPRPVLLEGLKIQLIVAQNLINGNEVEIEKKFAIAIACVIFSLLGAPIAFRFPRAGVGLTIGVSLGVFGIYYCGLVAGESFARRGYLPAFVAMWGTNMILLALGVILTLRLGTEGTTNRGSEFGEAWSRFVDRFRRARTAPTAG